MGLVALASLLPFVLLAIYGLHGYFAQERNEELARLSGRAASLARAVDRELRGYIEMAEVLARSRYLRAGNLAAFEDIARDAAGGSNGSRPGGYFALLDRSGQHLVNTRVARGAPLPSTLNREELRRVMEAGRPTFGDLEVSPTSGDLILTARVPIIVEGEVRYVLAFAPHVYLIDDVLQDADWSPEWRANIVDGQGRIIGRPRGQLFGSPSIWDARRRAAGLTGAGRLHGEDRGGRDAIAAFHALQLSDWYVYVWISRDVLMAPERAAFWLIGGGIAAALLVSLTAAYAAGRAVQGAIERVLAAARSLGQGEPVSFEHTRMQEANDIGAALVDASREIAVREARLREREQHSRLLLRELSHRSKNLLAVIEAMARQAGRVSGSRGEFLASFGARITSLAQSHDLLVETNWEGVRLADLIRTQLAAFVDAVEQRITMNGPDLVLRPEAAQNLGMALHELGTNASKHGALSVPGGHIRIDWEEYRDATGDAHLRMRWQETDGPPVTLPSGKGFGRAILEYIVASALGGRAHLDWRTEGLVWELDVPATSAVIAREPELIG